MRNPIETILQATIDAEIRGGNMRTWANLQLRKLESEELVDESFLERIQEANNEIYKMLIPYAFSLVLGHITRFEADELLHLDYEAKQGMIDRMGWGEDRGMVVYYKNGSVRIFPHDRHDAKYHAQDMINYYGSWEAWQAYEKEYEKAQAEFDRLKNRGADDEELQAAAEHFRKTLARSAFAPQ